MRPDLDLLTANLYFVRSEDLRWPTGPAVVHRALDDAGDLYPLDRGPEWHGFRSRCGLVREVVRPAARLINNGTLIGVRLARLLIEHGDASACRKCWPDPGRAG